MKVTCEQEGRHFLTVFLDGETYKKIHISIFGQKPKIPEEVLSEEELDQIMARLELQGAKQFALRKLAAQSLLSNKLNDLLKERLVDPAVINQIIADCQNMGYLNDKEWMDSFVRGQQRKRVGPAMIKVKLLQKGVRGALLDEIAHSDQAEQIQGLLEKRYRNRDLKDFKQREKVIAALMRKGYSLDAIFQVIGN